MITDACVPWCALILQTRQALGGVSSSSTFQPISLERYHHALADADKFAAWLQDYHGTTAQLQAALQGAGASMAQPACCMFQQHVPICQLWIMLVSAGACWGVLMCVRDAGCACVCGGGGEGGGTQGRVRRTSTASRIMPDKLHQCTSAAHTQTVACALTAVMLSAPAGFLGATSTAVSTCPLPSLYSERYDTHELRALPHPPPPKVSTVFDGFCQGYIWP
jgi:hypothetical protein